MEETKELWRKLADEWEKKEGMDVAKFWAGKMALAARVAICAPATSVSDKLLFLDWVVDQYDAVIFSRTIY